MSDFDIRSEAKLGAPKVSEIVAEADANYVEENGRYVEVDVGELEVNCDEFTVLLYARGSALFSELEYVLEDYNPRSDAVIQSQPTDGNSEGTITSLFKGKHPMDVEAFL